ncbi:MAG: hypothetical protein ACOY16_12310 [Chloroflexota bacterium]
MKPLLWLFILLIFLSGCTNAGATEALQSTSLSFSSLPPDAVIFEVVNLNGQARMITKNELLSLHAVSLELDGKEETGFRLMDVLTLAGIKEYHSLTISGGGRSIALAADQVNEQIILAFTKNPTLKLAAASIPKSQWIKSVSKIEIE